MKIADSSTSETDEFESILSGEHNNNLSKPFGPFYLRKLGQNKEF